MVGRCKVGWLPRRRVGEGSRGAGHRAGGRVSGTVRQGQDGGAFGTEKLMAHVLLARKKPTRVLIVHQSHLFKSRRFRSRRSGKRNVPSFVHRRQKDMGDVNNSMSASATSVMPRPSGWLMEWSLRSARWPRFDFSSFYLTVRIGSERKAFSLRPTFSKTSRS